MVSQKFRKKASKRNRRKPASNVSLQQLLADGSTNHVHASLDTLDARSLLSAFAPKPETRIMSKQDASDLSHLKDHETKINQLFDDSIVNDSEKSENVSSPQNSNRYPRRGSPFLFWERIGLPDSVLNALKLMQFTHPTPIQTEALPTLIQDVVSKRLKAQRDVVISSETGSGKTLVLALPIIVHLLQELSVEDGVSFGHPNLLHSLILTPTRELARQLEECMSQLAQCSVGICVGSVVGGMSLEKQQRLLNKHPQILIGTPGRIWDLLPQNEGCFLGHGISARLRFLVLDEVDKLMQHGRFNELRRILGRIRLSHHLPGTLAGVELASEQLVAGHWDPVKKVFVPEESNSNTEDSNIVHRSKKDHPKPLATPPPPPPKGQKTRFVVVSATLGLKVQFSQRSRRGRHTLRIDEQSTTKRVLKSLHLRPHMCDVYMINEGSAVASSLSEAFIRCPNNTKDLYLWYFLRTNQIVEETHRTIIFVNAVSMIRRLVGLFTQLHMKPAYLHAEMQQRQRIKMMERFRSGVRPIMLATDVAARGLDVGGVEHIVHYQLPRRTDGYIHRCGRTARVGQHGFSLLLVGAEEFTAFKKLESTLTRTNQIHVFPVNTFELNQLREPLKLANDLDLMVREYQKHHLSSTWLVHAEQTTGLDGSEMSRYTDKIYQPLKMEAKNEQHRLKKQWNNAVRKLERQLNNQLHALNNSGPKGSYPTAPLKLATRQELGEVQERAQFRMSGKRQR